MDTSTESQIATPALVEKYLEHVRVERRLAARTVELYAIHLKTLAEKTEITNKINAKVTKLETEVKPKKKDLGTERDYYGKLTEWQKSIP